MTTRIAALITIAAALVASPASAQAAAPTLAEAKKALTAAQDAAAKMNANLSCVIVDSRGDVVAAERMDRARFFTIGVATGKARASAIFGQPSASLGNIGTMKIDQTIDGPPMLFIQGAVPIARNNQALGAMGCSGGSGQQDEDAAKAGVAAMPVVARGRLDQLVVDRGLAPSRERARALILGGHVLVDGQPHTKAGTQINAEAEIALAAPDHPYVGRGGVKLAHALDVFGIAAAGREALDIGASTGGFTDVLLQRGAVRVVALDVGHGQLDWGLRNDPRVVVIEKFNARSLSPADLPGPVDIVVIDVSFISLRQILPVVPALLRPRADVVALVKPQFEAGRSEVGRGVIRDAAVHERVLAEVAAAGAEVGLARVGSTPSPITGAKGNQEFFLHLRA